MGACLLLISLLSNTPLHPPVHSALRVGAVFAFAISALITIFRSTATRSVNTLLNDAQQQRQALAAAIRSHPLSRTHVVTLGLLMSLGFALRIIFINQPIRTDEAVTYLHYVSRSLPLALANYSAPNNHLFHTFLAWISVHILGNTELALRLPAFVMGLLLIPVTYGMGSVLANRRAGLLAAALIAVSSVLIEYSTNARGYTLQCVLFGLSIIMAYTAQRSLSAVRWGLLALLLALGFYTVPTMLYPFGGLMLWLLADILMISAHQTPKTAILEGADDTWGQRPALLRAWLLCGLLTACFTLILYTPVLILSGVSAIVGNSYVQSLTMTEFVQQLPDAWVRLWMHWHTSIPPIIAACLGVGALISVRRGLRVPLTPLIPCVLWSLVALAVQRVIPFERNWLPFLPLYLVCASAGLIWAWDQGKNPSWIGWLVGGLLIGGLALNIVVIEAPYTSTETGTFRDAKAVMQDLKPLLRPGDRVVVEHPSGDSLDYYATQLGVDWHAYIDRDSTTGIVYLVVNTEYPQTAESVARVNGVDLNRYTATTLHTYRLAALILLEQKPR